MSKRSQEKRKTRSKEKKLAKRRMQGMSPLSRLAGTAEETCECWVQYDKQDDRTRNLLAIRPVRGGGSVAGFFLIDMDCLGVKDAFVWKDVDAAGLRETMRERSREDGTTFVKMTLGEMRGLVASAMRWTLAHPFRLPAEIFEAVRLLGEALDVEHASTTEFGTEEGLFYYGLEADLERALKGVTLDEFLDREDVDFEFVDDFEGMGEGEFEEESFEGEDFEPDEKEERVMRIADEMVRLTEEDARRWCAENGEKPADALYHASFIHVSAILAGISAIQEGMTKEAGAKFREEAMMSALDKYPDSEEEDLLTAIKQVGDSAAADADALVTRAIDRVNGGGIVDVTAKNVLTTEP